MKKPVILRWSFLLSVIAIIFFCAELPEDPLKTPDNADIHFITGNRNTTVNQGASLRINLAIHLEQYISSIYIKSTCGQLDTIFLPQLGLIQDTLHFNPFFTEASPCTVTAMATLINSPALKFDTLEVLVLPVNTTIPPADTAQPVMASVPTALAPGKVDTLVFVVDNSNRSDRLTMGLVTPTPLDPAVFKVLPSGSDTILIEVTPSNSTAAGTVPIGVVTSNGVTPPDTAWYPVTFVGEDAVVWNTATVTVPAIEGKPLQHDLRQYLTLPLTGIVVFSPDAGTITDTVWQWTPPFGSPASVPVTISTTKNGLPSPELTILTNVTAADVTAPVLQLADPTLDGSKTGSSQVTVTCKATDSEAGIGSVLLTCGSTSVEAVRQSEGIYTGVVSILQSGVPTPITITATDKSMSRNSSHITITVTVDPSIPGTDPTGITPVITTQLPPALKVNEGAALTLSVTATGTPVPGYQWFKDDVPLSGKTTAEIVIPAVVPGDAGTYHVVINNGVGTAVTSTGTVVTVPLKVKVTDPKNTTVQEGAKATFTVEASGEPPFTYQWLRNGVPVSGGTLSTYSIDIVSAADNGVLFSCSVTNQFSDAVSAAAALTVSTLPVYKVTFNTDGGGTVAAQNIKEGEKATEPPAPTKTGYEFEGWYESTTKFDFSKAITAAVTVTAKWTQLFTLTYDANGGTGSVPAAKQYKNGTTVSIEAPGSITNNGCTCIGWGDGKNMYNKSSDLTQITMTIDTTLWAVWQATVTFDYQDNNKTEKLTAILNQNLSSMPAISVGTKNSANNATFNGWFTAKSGGQSFTAGTKITGNMTVYAQWETIQYEVKFTDPTGGNSTITIKVDAGKTITQMGQQCPTLNNQSGRNFIGWSNSSICTAAITAATTVTAQWQDVDCSLVPARKDWDVINFCAGVEKVMDVSSPNCAGIVDNYIWHMGIEGMGSPLTDTYDNGEGGYYYGQGSSRLTVKLGGAWTEFFCVVKFKNGQQDTSAYWRVGSCE